MQKKINLADFRGFSDCSNLCNAAGKFINYIKRE